MRKYFAVAGVLNLALLSAVLLFCGTTFGQDKKFEDLAQRVVTTSANIKPGDVVVISGGKHTIPVMEALSIEAMKAGGLVTMFLGSDRVDRAFFSDVPEKYLEQRPAYFAEWLKHIDVWIGLPGNENPKAVYGDVPEDRFAKAAKANQFIEDMLNKSKVRVISIGYPTEEQADINKLDFSTYEAMHWDAVNADYQQISEKGKKIKAILQRAKVVKVTTPGGTDFRFSVGDRPVFLDDGIVTKEKAKSRMFIMRTASLPGGAIFVAPVEHSANGKVAIPKHKCRYAPLTGISFDLKDGKLQNFKADVGAKCFEETIAPYAGPKDMFGYFSIGLNPGLKVIEEGGDYRPDRGAGLVWMGIGSNALLGGKNKTQGGFTFPLVKATVEADGKLIVKDGELAF